MFNACFVAILFRNTTFRMHRSLQTKNGVFFSLPNGQCHCSLLRKLTYPKYLSQFHFPGPFCYLDPICKHNTETPNVRVVSYINRVQCLGPFRRKMTFSESAYSQHPRFFLSLTFVSHSVYVCVSALWNSLAARLALTHYHISFSPLPPRPILSQIASLGWMTVSTTCLHCGSKFLTHKPSMDPV